MSLKSLVYSFSVVNNRDSKAVPFVLTTVIILGVSSNTRLLKLKNLCAFLGFVNIFGTFFWGGVLV
jgi:hypothetical protein